MSADRAPDKSGAYGSHDSHRRSNEHGFTPEQEQRYQRALVAHDVRGRAFLQHLREIERTLRHAEGTRSTGTDSWLNGYQQDVRWLVERLKERIS